MSLLSSVRTRVFGISPKETSFEVRGFAPGDPEIRAGLEKNGQTFVWGYNSALENDDPVSLATHLNSIENRMTGFAFEGAAMALTLLDFLSPFKRNRLQTFIAGPADKHAYMAHVGAGWALARLRRRVEGTLKKMDPLLGWLVLDGYGFHEGYFAWQRTIEKQIVPGRLKGYSRNVFDQGVGRSLWFVKCADVDRICATIASFPPERRRDIWAGIGLACSYAGGVDESSIKKLRDSTGSEENRLALAQGVAFAAKARQRAENIVPDTQMACEVICGLTAEAAAEITDISLRELPNDRSVPPYELWRKRIQDSLKGVAVK